MMIRAAFKQLARAAGRHEAVALVLDHGDRWALWPCANAAADPAQHYQIAAAEWLTASKAGRIAAVLHSHPDSSPPSQADHDAASALRVPHHVYAVASDAWHCLPAGRRYTGREFMWGTADCWALVRDWYASERAVWLPGTEGCSGEGWERSEPDAFVRRLARYGFAPIALTDAAPGDVLLFALQSSQANHSAILLHDNQILHHLQHRLSAVDDFDGYWRKVMTHALRYTAS